MLVNFTAQTGLKTKDGKYELLELLYLLILNFTLIVYELTHLITGQRKFNKSDLYVSP